MRSVVAIALCTACSFTGGGETPDAGPGGDGAIDTPPSGDDMVIDPDGDPLPTDWLAGYAKRKPIAIAAPSAPQTDVPLAVIVRGDPELATAQADGSDFAITAADGLTPIGAVEVVAFDRTSGTLELWVRLASLTAATQLYLYYEGPPATRSPAWPASYAGVWHLGDVAIARDSAADVDLLPASGPATPTATAMAPTPSAYDFANADCMRIDDAASQSLDFAMASFSYSIWTRVTSSVGEYDAPIWNGGTSMGEPGYTMLLGQNTWHAKLHDGQQYIDATFGTEAALMGRWVHLAVVVDRATTTIRTYVDGVKTDDESLAAIDSLQNMERFSLGLTADAPFRGQLDEVRVYAGAVPVERLAFEHRNLTDPTFVVVGPAQLR